MQLVIWADNCSGQNKNWFQFTALVQCINTWGPRVVELKYPESGHTFMAAESKHGAIGKLLKNEVVATFQDFKSL